MRLLSCELTSTGCARQRPHKRSCHCSTLSKRVLERRLYRRLYPVFGKQFRRRSLVESIWRSRTRSIPGNEAVGPHGVGRKLDTLKCHYGDDPVSEFCHKALSILRDIYVDALARDQSLSPDQLAYMFLTSIRWFAPAFKISSWADENEWRLSVSGLLRMRNGACTRPDGSASRPHLVTE